MTLFSDNNDVDVDGDSEIPDDDDDGLITWFQILQTRRDDKMSAILSRLKKILARI